MKQNEEKSLAWINWVQMEIPLKNLERMEYLLKEKNVKYTVSTVRSPSAVSACIYLDPETPRNLQAVIAKKCGELCEKA